MAMKERSAIWPWKGDVPPHLPRTDNMPKAFLLPGDPGRVDKAAEVLENFEIVGQNREFRMGVGTLDGVAVGICSTGIGGASTEIVMVELAALGVEVAIRTGGMGALAPDLALGNFLVVVEAVRNSGVAAFYAEPGERVLADIGIVTLLDTARGKLGLPGRPGTCATADGYYRAQGRPDRPDGDGTPAILDQLAALGADGVEMEAEIVLAAGHALGMRAGAVLAVHAHRLSDGWLEDYDKTQRDLLRLGAMAAARAVAGR
ncbi:nucleoside phosphorylase [Neoaquamicrobium sediminum]|uniref:nucleoside phosphorylase n=1 Tax=Neoaquamicrobium sediminum TaxID=1849104 RepID=UPI003BAAEC36